VVEVDIRGLGPDARVTGMEELGVEDARALGVEELGCWIGTLVGMVRLMGRIVLEVGAVDLVVVGSTLVLGMKFGFGLGLNLGVDGLVAVVRWVGVEGRVSPLGPADLLPCHMALVCWAGVLDASGLVLGPVVVFGGMGAVGSGVLLVRARRDALVNWIRSRA